MATIDARNVYKTNDNAQDIYISNHCGNNIVRDYFKTLQERAFSSYFFVVNEVSMWYFKGLIALGIDIKSFVSV